MGRGHGRKFRPHLSVREGPGRIGNRGLRWRRRKTEVWGSDYQISVLIRPLATLWRMSIMELNGDT